MGTKQSNIYKKKDLTVEIDEDITYHRICYHINTNWKSKYYYVKLDELLTCDDFDINTQNIDGQTLLHKFADFHDIEIMKKLIAYGASVNIKDNLGRTPLFFPLYNCYLSAKERYNILINNGCDASIRDKYNHNALYYILDYYDVNLVKILTKAGATIDIYKDIEPEKQFHIAILLQDLCKMLDLLIKDNSLVNSYISSKIYDCITPLFIACKNGFYEDFLLLLRKGAIINNKFDINNYILITMENCKHKKSILIFKELIKLGLNVKITSSHYNLTLLYFCANCDSEFVDILIENGVNIHHTVYAQMKHSRNIYTVDGEAIHFISQYNTNIEIFEKFFKYGASPNVQNSSGCTPFMELFIDSNCLRIHDDNSFEIIKLFIDNGAYINLKDNKGNSALTYMSEYNFDSKDLINKVIKYLYSIEKINFIDPDFIKNKI